MRFRCWLVFCEMFRKFTETRKYKISVRRGRLLGRMVYDSREETTYASFVYLFRYLCSFNRLYCYVYCIVLHFSVLYFTELWARLLSRYSGWLRAGWSGTESRWGQCFPPIQTVSGAHPASCKMGTGSFPAVKCGRGVLLTTHPLLVPRLWKSRAIPLPTLWATPDL